MGRIKYLLVCLSMLLMMCGCVDTVSQEKTDVKVVSQYYFEDVGQAGGRFYFTTYTDGTPETTILSSDDAEYVQREICRFAGTVHVEYVSKSYDSSNGERIFFYVRPDIGSGRIYSYTIADNSIQIFLKEDCSNMIPDTTDSTYAWVIKDSKLNCVNMATHSVVKERSYTVEQLNLVGKFPNGFFGKVGDCDVQISMDGTVIHIKSVSGSNIDEMTVTQADVDTALL